jgi:hypothetical protein
MPKLLCVRGPQDAAEVRRLASSRHAPGDWILQARMVVRSWAGEWTTVIAAGGRGRLPRLTGTERSIIVVLAQG